MRPATELTDDPIARGDLEEFEPEVEALLDAARGLASALELPRLLGVAGRRIHGTTGHGPLVVFEQHERAQLRQVQKLLRLGERYTAERLEAACAHALAHELVDVRRLERIIVLAIKGDPRVDEPLSAAQVLPSRFARPGSAFDHRFGVPSMPTASAAVRA